MATNTKSRTTAAPKRVVKKPKNVQHELNAYIPEEAVAERYVGRKVHGVWDATIADIAIRDKKNILLMGDTGAGKTMFGEAYAAKRRMHYYSLPCDVSIDPSALFGRMQPTDTPGKFEWQDGPASEVVRNGGVLNISEINFMPPKIAASLYPLLDNRRYIPLLGHHGEVVRAHPNLLIIADMNPNYRGTMELNAAFMNRFDFKIPWNYEDSVEERLVNFPTLRNDVKKLRDMHGTELVTPVSTNMMMEFEQFANDPQLGLEFATHNFVSAFQSDERQAVAKVFELSEEDMKKDMRHYQMLQRRRRNAAETVVSDDELEEIEMEFEEEEDA